LYGPGGNFIASDSSSAYGYYPQLAADQAPDGRYVVKVTGVGDQAYVPVYGSLGHFDVSVTQIDRLDTPLVTLAPSEPDVLVATWPAPYSASTRPARYRISLCSNNQCGEYVETTARRFTFAGLDPTVSYSVALSAGNGLGFGLLRGSESVRIIPKPVPPLLNKAKWDPTTRQLKLDWCCSLPTNYGRLQAPTVKVTRVSTGETLTQSELGGETVTFVIPQSWGEADLDVSLLYEVVAAYVGTAWDFTNPSPSRISLARQGSTATPISPSVPRTGAPSASGSGAGGNRTDAPQS
jgi:hypothetical protein